MTDREVWQLWRQYDRGHLTWGAFQNAVPDLSSDQFRRVLLWGLCLFVVQLFLGLVVVVVMTVALLVQSGSDWTLIGLASIWCLWLTWMMYMRPTRRAGIREFED